MRTARNVAIVMALAAVVAFAPAGSNAAEVVLTAISMAFLTAIAWTAYIFSRQNQLTLAALTDGRRAILYGAIGVIVLLVAGTTKLFATGGGTLLWIVLLGASLVAIWRVWVEANTY
ncbi:MAG: hypothetical protein WD827_07850 [Solirubrobacterales bacterium]